MDSLRLPGRSLWTLTIWGSWPHCVADLFYAMRRGVMRLKLVAHEIAPHRVTARRRW